MVGLKAVGAAYNACARRIKRKENSVILYAWGDWRISASTTLMLSLRKSVNGGLPRA
jgi:hypothetical protein